MSNYITVAEAKAIAIACGEQPQTSPGADGPFPEHIRDPERRKAAEALVNAIKGINR